MRTCPPVSSRTAIIFCSLATLGGARAHGQTLRPVVLYTFDGSQPGERLGWSVVGPGDLNGDGVPDVLAGGPGDFIGGSFPGIVRAYSGLDGSVLYTVSGQQNADGFGMALAALADIDGDGRPDFAVGAPYDDATGADSGSAYVFSGASGTLIRKVNGGGAGDAFGWSLCDGGDFNGDTMPDLAVGAPLADAPLADSGKVYLIDPVTGVVIDSRSGATALGELGYALSATHSYYNQVSYRYIVIGQPGAPNQGGGGGRVSSWSSDGSYFDTTLNCSAGTFVGLSVLATWRPLGVAGDVMAEAYVEVRVQSGGETILATMDSPAGPNSWGTLSSADLIGWPAAALSRRALNVPPNNSPWGLAGNAFGGNGESAAVIGTGYAAPAFSLPGNGSRAWSIDILGLLNVDTTPDCAIGDPFAVSPSIDQGRVVVCLLTSTTPTAVYCTAKINSQGCTPQCEFVGAPSLSVGDNFIVTATSVLNNKPGLLIWSLNPTVIPFGGGTLCVGPLLHRTGIQFSGGNPPPSDCSGTYSFHFSQAYMASKALTPGVTVYCQYYSRDDGFAPPASIGLTDAVRFTVLP